MIQRDFRNIIFSAGRKNVQEVPVPYLDPAGSAKNWPPGSGSVIQDYGSADLEEILFTNPKR